MHGSGLTALQWREKPDEVTRTIHFPVDGPTRLRLERRRNMVTLDAGKEGGALAEMGSTELAPFSPMYASLGVCAHDDKAETTAVFSDVTVEVLPVRASLGGTRRSLIPLGRAQLSRADVLSRRWWNPTTKQPWDSRVMDAWPGPRRVPRRQSAFRLRRRMKITTPNKTATIPQSRRKVVESIDKFSFPLLIGQLDVID